jgi:hypothetical protein
MGELSWSESSKWKITPLDNAGAVVETGTAAQIGCMSIEYACEPAIVYPGSGPHPTISIGVAATQDGL